ncbi:son of sevenless homolog 2 [Trichonephila inaurata madagascariensis]|uniref:Son of sevenless homolog 2 n=1 Tax=Trichonephila inaurata madagascariensis TaxID=2747483 RepID=A0A8X6J8M0_9ARAC|nr:son of sevenless homolog 2 [Trichonephila inaurata madagascariensis]
MFASSRDADQIYDFDSEENSGKWKCLLINALSKVQFQVHPSLTAKDDALRYVETLIFRLLGMLCAAQPHTVQDVEERVQKTFPHPIDKWAIGDAQSAIEKGKKKSPLVLPVEKIHPLLQKEILGYKVDIQVTQYIVAVLEYISADILKLAGNYVKNIRHVEITCQDIKVAMCADKVLMDMFYQDEDVSLSIEEEPTRRTSLTYDEVVKDLIHEEKQYIRDLNMIIKVFREPFVEIFYKSKELDVIFSNILEIYDFSVYLLGTFEDALEMAEEDRNPSIGTCYEELAEYQEFDVYDKYAHDILMPESKEKLMALLQQPNVRHSLQSAGHGFTQAVKYVLPKLLLGPVFHCFQYFDFLKVLKKLTPSAEDRESLEQAEGVFQPLKAELERLCSNILPKRKQGEAFSRMYNRGNRQASIQKMNELQRSIDGWEGKDIGQCCNDFVMDGILGKVGSGGRRLTERQVFLFDGLMILCKPNNKRSSVTGPVAEYRLKEKYYLRKIEIIDREDTDELKNAFEIAPRDQLHIILFAKTPEEKSNWMANLIMLNTRSMLERTLDSILLDEEKKHPLRLPSPDKYRFAVEDSESNIIFEENKSSAGVPVIKSATLLKLVERLTYHMYADPMFVRTFLTTYRSFCQPLELLDLLIERFEIEDPPPPAALLDRSLDGTVIENYKNSYREDLKRFRKEYCQPVQFRVLNVLRHWVDHHFYDFERDPSLLTALRSFLEDKVKGKSMRKWVESINKVIMRRLEPVEESREITFGFEKIPPPIEWFLSTTYEKFDLLTLHPIEIARQLTLLEFELYRSVKPSELVGSVWTKKDKMKTSPNLLRMIHHSSNFTFYVEKCIVETENFEERVAVVSRVLEIMIVLQDLNNFTGVLEIVGAMNSACVHRLEHTLNGVKYSLKKSLEEAQELNSDHFKKYQEKLRSINPPCVPFFGMYLTNILHIEEGNPDFLPIAEGMINFSKRRKVAEITGEIQQYQNQPYCLTSQADIRRFLENLDPLEGRTDKAFNDYLYNKSLEIEPRGCKQPPKFPRKWPDVPLKSPGIKPRLSRSGHHPNSLPTDSRSFSISSSQINQDDDDSQSCVVTPPNPSTPLTPTFSTGGFNSDHSIFAPVMIGSGTLAIETPPVNYPSSPSFISNSLPSSLPPPLPNPPSLPPPPLPPRRKRESSIGDTSPCTKQATDAPLLPPRETSPPPLPPRRDLSGASGTLPRMHSASNFPPVHRPSNSGWSNVPSEGTLPRRNSALDVANLPQTAPRRLSQSSLNDTSAGVSPSSHFSLSPLPVPHHTSAGVLDNDIALLPPPHSSRSTPQLPPKTHRQTLLTNNHAPR